MTAITSFTGKTILAWEDIGLNLGADSDYNDIIISLEGVDSIDIPNFQNHVKSDSNWLQTPVGKNIVNYF